MFFKTLSTLLVSMVLLAGLQARDYEYEAQAASASALAMAELNREKTPDVTPAVKTCLCSVDCVCGCNETGVCDCAGPRVKPQPIVKVQTSAPTSYGSISECPPGTYQFANGRYYPLTTQTYVQPQQYALPATRYSYGGYSGGGSCGPGGCR